MAVPDGQGSWNLNPTPEETRAQYEKARRDFSDDDVKKLLTEEEGPTFDELIEELKTLPEGNEEGQ